MKWVKRAQNVTEIQEQIKKSFVSIILERLTNPKTHGPLETQWEPLFTSRGKTEQPQTFLEVASQPKILPESMDDSSRKM